jgi:hypothetical protein
MLKGFVDGKFEWNFYTFNVRGCEKCNYRPSAGIGPAIPETVVAAAGQV